MIQQTIEQMSSQIYNKIGFSPNFVGFNHKSMYLRSILPNLSSPTMAVLLSFAGHYNFKQRISDVDLHKQTIFTIDWTYFKTVYSMATKKRITAELKRHNLALRLSRDTYVVSLDLISAFTLPQRKRYIDIITSANRTQLPKHDSLSGSPNI
jgi:FMN-dependent NADH-azoreductase